MRCIINCLSYNDKLVELKRSIENFIINYSSDFEDIVFIVHDQQLSGYSDIRLKNTFVHFFSYDSFLKVEDLWELNRIFCNHSSEWLVYTRLNDKFPRFSHETNSFSFLNSDIIYCFSNTLNKYCPFLIKIKARFDFEKLINNELPYRPSLSYRYTRDVFKVGKYHSIVPYSLKYKISNKCTDNKANSKVVLFIFEALSSGGVRTRTNDEMKVFNSLGYTVIALNMTKASYLDGIESFVKVFSCHLNSQNLSHVVNFLAYIRLIIDNYKVSVISSHSVGTGLLSASIASQLDGIPLIQTLNGAAFFVKGALWNYLYFNIYPQGISQHFGMSYMINRYIQAFIPESISLPNVVDIEVFRPHMVQNVDKRWLILGRVAAAKIAGISRFINFAYCSGIPGVVIAGSNPNNTEKTYISRVLRNLDCPEGFVTVIGHQNNIAKLINCYSGVAGVGRVVLEGLACEKPTCVIGVDGKIRGLVTPNNFDTLAEYNFNGGNLNEISYYEFKRQIRRIQENIDDLSILRKKVIEKYCLDTWLRHFKDFEKGFKFRENDIIIELYYSLLYFQVQMNEDSNGIESDLLIKCIEDLVYSKKWFSVGSQIKFEKMKEDYLNNSNYPNSYRNVKDLIFCDGETVPQGIVLIKVIDLYIDSHQDFHEFKVPSNYSQGLADYVVNVSYTAITDSASKYPVIMSFEFANIKNQDRNINVEDIRDLSCSKRADIGFFKYMVNNHLEIDFKVVFDLRLPKHIIVTKVKLIKWKLENDRYYHVKNLIITGLNNEC